jgi:hypothetical protein
MPTFLQSVELPERCFLQEVLFWVAFQRLPLAHYYTNNDGQEFRTSNEVGEYAIDFVDEYLSDDETARAGIPRDPRWPLHADETVTLPVATYDEVLANPGIHPEDRAQLEYEREQAQEYQRDVEAWRLHYNRAVEYPASQIFVALKSGTLRARGRLLPALEATTALTVLKADGRNVFDVAPTDIPPAFWSLQGIDFTASVARNDSDHYCHVSLRTEDVLSVFPGERQEVVGVERIGSTLVLSEKPPVARSRSRRGRPPYPWDAFHLEMADLLARGELPKKKEATIEHFQVWFLREHGVTASRSVIGEKLKPYYDRFIRNVGQKSRE